MGGFGPEGGLRLPRWLRGLMSVLAVLMALAWARGLFVGPGHPTAPGGGGGSGLPRMPLAGLLVLGVGVVLLGLGLWGGLTRLFWGKYFPTRLPPPPMRKPENPPPVRTPSTPGGEGSAQTGGGDKRFPEE